eukprot:s696_g4.t1
MANAEAIGRSKVNPRGLPYDPLETVLAGQKELHSKTGPEALLRQKRIAQLKQMPVPRAQRHILEKASSLLPTPLLEANSAGRRKRRLNLPQRLLALTEFKTWMAERFPSPEAARSELRLTTVEGGWRDLFVQALAQRDYPYGTIGAKVFFFFCDADEDDLISWQDITEALEASSGNPGVPPAFPPIALFSSQIAPMANVSDARDMEIPMAATQTAEHQEQEGNVMKELLDRPYINKHTGLDFLVMCFMGAILGLLSIPYCAGVEDIPKFWLRRFGPAGFVEENLELSSQIFFRRGGASWILFCWGFCTAVGVLKVLVKLDKFPSFIDELKHQHVDPLVNLKVVVCCIASLSAGAVMGLEAGLGSVGAALGFLLWKAAEKILPSTSDTLSDQRRRIYILAGLAGAFGTIFPAPVVSVILVSEIATAGTERSVAEEEFMTGRRLPKKVFFYLVPVAVSAFVVAYAVNYAITKSHKIPPPLYDRGYDNLSVFTGVGLGAIAAVAVVIFLLIGALMKAIFTLVGSPLERRLGVPTRQIVTASLAGLITGVAIYLFPLACGSGKDGMMPTRSLSHADKITVAELFGLALAKVVAYWACAHGGLVGGIFYPLLYFGLTLGEICAKVFHIGNHLVHMAILVKRHVALTFVVLALSVATQVGSGAFQAPGPLLHETVVSSRDARRLKRKWRFQAVTVWGKVCSHPVISRTTALVTWMLHSLPSILTGFSLSPIDAVPQQACHYNSFLLSCAPDLVSPGSELSASAGRDLDFEVQPVDKQWTDSTDLEKQTKLCADASQQHERPCTERGFCRVWPGPAESCSAETARSKPTAVERDPTECPHLDEWCNTVPSQKMHETMTSQPDGCSVPASRMGKSFSDAKILESFSLIDNDDDDQMWTACQIAEYEQHYIPNLVPQKLGAVPRGCETFLTFRAFAPGGCGAFLSHARSAFNSVLPSGRDSVLQAELNSECAFDNTPQIHEAKALQPVPEGADDRSAVSVGTEIMGTPGNNLLPIPDTSNDIGFSDLYVKQGDALQSCHRHSTCAASAHTSHTPPHARAEVEVRVPMPKVFALIAQFAWFSTCIIACGASIAAMLCIASNVAAEPSEATSEANPPSVAQLLLARPALITACLLGIAMLAIMCHMFPGTTNALRVPPAWGPEQEQNYPFRQWTRDVMLWSIASEMDPARKAASVMLVLKGAAKELSRQIPPQAIVDGGLIHGVQVDPLTYLMHALQERFGNLGEEVRVQAITELMGFNRKGNEPIDSLLVRFDSIRSRAAEQGGAIVSVQGVTWILLRAIEISDQQLIHLLTPFHN